MHILLVEDDERLATLVRGHLLGKQHTVAMTRDGATGRMLAATGRFDVIILALSAPGLCGVELCRQIRAAGVTAPILICGAGGAVDDCVAGLDAGADDYLVKPFVVEELIARVHALGRRGQPIGPELLRRVH